MLPARIVADTAFQSVGSLGYLLYVAVCLMKRFTRLALVWSLFVILLFHSLSDIGNTKTEDRRHERLCDLGVLKRLHFTSLQLISPTRPAI